MEVGDILPGLAEITALPYGAVFGPNEDEAYVRTPGGAARLEGEVEPGRNYVATLSLTSFSRNYNSILSIPDVARVGALVTPEEIERLPDFSVLSVDDLRFVKVPDKGLVIADMRGAPMPRAGVFKPTIEMVISRVGPLADEWGLDRLKWNYRQAVAYGIEARDWNIDFYRSDFTELGIDREWEMGEKVKIRYIPDLDVLGPGSVVHIGSGTTISAYKALSWQCLYGKPVSFNTSLGKVVDVVNDVYVPEPQWHRPKALSMIEVAEMAEWKAYAYRVGMSRKRQQGWCTEFDQIVAQVGIDESCATSPLLRKGKAAIISSPEGSVWMNAARDLFIRRGSSNKTRTVRITGEGPNRCESGWMIGTAGVDCTIDYETARKLKPGAIIIDSDGDKATIGETGRLHEADMSYSWSQLFSLDEKIPLFSA